MQYTVQEMLYDIRSLIDEYNEDGTVIPQADVATIETNAIRFINMARREAYKLLKTYNTFEYANKPYPNLLGLMSNFDIKEFIGVDQNYPENGVEGAKAYYFEVDNDATVYIEENNGGWSVIDTITVTGVTSLTGYKGLISSNYPVRLRFSGSTFYRHTNRCLFSYPFKSTSIPDYRPWVKVDMPSDFGEVDEIVEEVPVRQYQNAANYKWEGFNSLYVNYYYEGNIRVVYKVIPTDVTALTDVVTLNNPIAYEFIIAYAAARVATSENQKLVQYYEDKSNELKFEATRMQPASEESIQDVYFGGGIYG